MQKDIPLSVPNIKMDVINNLEECIKSGWVSTGGRFISEFEEKIASYVGVEEAVSMQSGTAGLHVALKVLGIQADDEVIVPTLTFIAAVNPVRYIGAQPVFMDCDENFCLDCEKLETFLKEECVWKNGWLKNRKSGRRVRAIIPVHIFGNLCNLERIMKLADDYQLRVIEDATEALGSYYTDGIYQKKFAGTIGDMGVFSFNANKIITTGGGGMIVSPNKQYLGQARYLGIQAKNDNTFFIHDEIGYNYRMLNLQAALGVSQIDDIEDFIAIKKKNYNMYKEALREIDGLKLLPFSSGRTNHWFYALSVDQEIFGHDRDELLYYLLEKGIQCRPVWSLIHKQKPYICCQAYCIEKAEKFEKTILNIPCSTSLSEEEIRYVIKQIAAI